MITAEYMNTFPTPKNLQQICKSISALEAIISPEWEYRYYSYQKDWSEDEEFCEMKDGSGSHLLISFSTNGTVINGFAIAYAKGTSKNILEPIPKVFHSFIYDEPIKSIGTTFCLWQLNDCNQWKNTTSQKEDGSEELLFLLDGKPETYKEWAEEYYEELFEDRELNLELVKAIYEGKTITEEIALEINSELEDLEQLKEDLDEIGYPHSMSLGKH